MHKPYLHLLGTPFVLLSLFTVQPAFATKVAGNNTGNEIGVSLGSYKYEEPGLMSLQGTKVGVDLRATHAISNKPSFLRGELRYAFGTVNYTSNGSGSHNGEQDWYLEGRLLVGNDWPQEQAVITTYTGLGYRFLL